MRILFLRWTPVALLLVYERSVALTLINTGATLYKPPTRGPQSFLPLAAFPDRVPAELVLPRSVPDLAQFVTDVVRMRGSEVVEVVL